MFHPLPHSLGISLTPQPIWKTNASVNKHTRNAWIFQGDSSLCTMVNRHQLKIHDFCPAFPFSCILEDLSHLKRWLFVLFLFEYGPTNKDIGILFHTVFLTKFPVTCEKNGSLKSFTPFFQHFPTHTIHVWYTYLHLVNLCGPYVNAMGHISQGKQTLRDPPQAATDSGLVQQTLAAWMLGSP